MDDWNLSRSLTYSLATLLSATVYDHVVVYIVAACLCRANIEESESTAFKSTTALYRLGELLKCERTVKFLACNPAGKLMVSAQVMVFASRGGAENLILCVSDTRRCSK
jgi:hypothetical protein